MANKINAKLGLKPQTRTRQATHGPAIDGAVRCPDCAGRHCLQTQSTNGRRLGSHWCGACGAFFSPAIARAAA